MLKLHDNYNPSPYPSAIQWIVSRCKQCVYEEDTFDFAYPLIRDAYNDDIYDNESHHNHSSQIGSLDWSMSVEIEDEDYEIEDEYCVSRYKSIENDQVLVKGFKIVGGEIQIPARGDRDWETIDDIFEHEWKGIRFDDTSVNMCGNIGVVSIGDIYSDSSVAEYLYQLFDIPYGKGKVVEIGTQQYTGAPMYLMV